MQTFNLAYRIINDEKVYPPLAHYDQFIEYNDQESCYDGYNLETIDFGHVTGSFETKILRKHIVKTLEEINP